MGKLQSALRPFWRRYINSWRRSTNNEAEYEALIAGLRIAARMGVRNLEAKVDS
ncbi:reverse transcriptase domain-containing protein, partial [Tanacetum coccineum]